MSELTISPAIQPDCPLVASTNVDAFSLGILTTVTDNRTSLTSNPDDSIHSYDPYLYLSSITFHQSFICPRTKSRVSYSDCGNKEGPVVVYVPPSGCSRWVGVFLDGSAREKGIRLVTPDRPGQGATPRVPLESRIEVAHQQMLSLLEHIHVKTVSFLTHSAGIYFLIPVLLSLLTSTSSSLPQILPRIFLSSPWVPTSISGSLLFPLIPTALIRNSHLLVPKLLPAVSSMATSSRVLKKGWKGMLGMSGFDMSLSNPLAVSNKAGLKLREDSQRSLPTADIHPPFRSQSDMKLTNPRMVEWVTENIPRSVGSKPAKDFSLDLVFDYMVTEGLWGWSQELLLCLGRANDGGMARLTERLISEWKEVGNLWGKRKDRIVGYGVEDIPDKLTVVLYWANGDGMIPLKGRVWLDNLISSMYGLELVRHELGSTSAHDTPINTTEVIEEIFSWVKANDV